MKRIVAALNVMFLTFLGCSKGTASNYKPAVEKVYGDKRYTIPFVLDADGDGVMEPFVGGQYYEGNWIDVFEIKDGKPKIVLSDGICV